MNTDFPRVLTLIRKERGISQKQAAADLGISQALLSHYEKGIRECGLLFLSRCADYYQVSCDYLLGRSPDRTGTQLTVEDIPEPDSAGKENTWGSSKAGILPVLNKKLIANSLNILFDLLDKSKNKQLITEVSSFLMLAVYRMFRVVHSANPKNQSAMFSIPKPLATHFADASMQMCEARASAIASGDTVDSLEAIRDTEPLYMTTENIAKEYPLFSSSLLNLIQNSEKKIGYKASKR
ncbi:MAG: helix-turn-helix domain-containing protein [Clostridiales bacterium]|uniref:Helix-turn-helix protein n=1 Tax=Harryflintia acetispora TaxID=1849041 RepID=A0A9X8UKL0_9FIRM|nr:MULTISPECIES: helix-turn-helix domain-containing protein [Oscillospiraceae]PWM38370.1 MAG: helix-turn-helix domain-containing protein [Clostridiales bacterium]RGB69783.1 helix-turn-helix domain-containing protein [Harryflintia acetispora]TCL44620.1 helix-turn-helix protein [Harryflintia acetispora]